MIIVTDGRGDLMMIVTDGRGDLMMIVTDGDGCVDDSDSWNIEHIHGSTCTSPTSLKSSQLRVPPAFSGVHTITSQTMVGFQHVKHISSTIRPLVFL